MLDLKMQLPASAPAGTVVKGAASQEGVSALLIVADTLSALVSLTLKWTLQTRAGTETVIPSLPVRFLAERADYFGGFSLDESEAIAAIQAALTTLTVPAVGLNQTAYAWVDIGHQQLSGDDEVSFQLTTSGTGVGGVVRAYAVDVPGRKEELHKFVEKPDGQSIFKLAREVWAYNQVRDIYAAGWGECLIKTNVGVGGSTRERSADVKAFNAMTACTGNFSSQGPGRSALLHREPRKVVTDGSITVTKTGTNLGDYTVFGLERLYLPGRTTENIRDEAARTATVRLAVEHRDPLAAKAAKLRGEL